MNRRTLKVKTMLLATMLFFVTAGAEASIAFSDLKSKGWGKISNGKNHINIRGTIEEKFSMISNERTKVLVPTKK